LTPVLHFHAPRLIVLRGRDRNEGTPATGNKNGILMRRTFARTVSPRSFLVLEHSLQPTPSPPCGLAQWPLLGACSMYPGEQFLTRLNPFSFSGLAGSTAHASDYQQQELCGMGACAQAWRNAAHRYAKRHPWRHIEGQRRSSREKPQFSRVN